MDLFPGRVDEALASYLQACRLELGEIDPRATELVAEIERLLAAGGKRLRPQCCFWGFRAAGGADGEPIVRAAAAIELLHSMALLHDDVMDRATVRRGQPTARTAQAQAAAHRGQPDVERVGDAVAILAGDVAAVLADRLLRTSGFAGAALDAAIERFERMRLEMAAGQFMDVTGAVGSPGRVAALKGGSYTIVGPLQMGALLAGGSDELLGSLRAFGEPLGEAFQVLDDRRDGDEPSAAPDPGTLLAAARAALVTAPIGDAEVRAALGSVCDLVERG
jgi:geranylgeranyl diphosphate synthase type I